MTVKLFMRCCSCGQLSNHEALGVKEPRSLRRWLWVPLMLTMQSKKCPSCGGSFEGCRVTFFRCSEGIECDDIRIISNDETYLNAIEGVLPDKPTP